MTSRGKFWGATGGPGKILGGQWPPPGTPLAPPLDEIFDQVRSSITATNSTLYVV